MSIALVDRALQAEKINEIIDRVEKTQSVI